MILLMTSFAVLSCDIVDNEELKKAVRKGEVDKVKDLLSMGANPNYRSSHLTMLMEAAYEDIGMWRVCCWDMGQT